MSSILEQVGRVIGGRYRLLAVVGAGASAQVFAADDTRLGRRVAVKLLHPALAGDATFLRKFQAEARLAASLNHRNVLHVYDWGDDEGMPYLVLEYLGGGSLRSLLDTGRLLTPQQAAALGAQAAHGLAYAHRRGLVHRDIKPANLLFDDDGRLLVADFGLARALAEVALTEPLGTVMGTARYASPEQVEGRAVDDRTDVYSLALTLYESVTGRVPFVGDTTVATLMARVGAVLPPARELGPLAPVLAQAAISEPLARLDAAALASELDALLQELDPPEPLPLSRPDVALPGLARALDRDPTERLGVVVPTTPAGSAAAPTTPAGSAAAPTLPAMRAAPTAPATTVPTPSASQSGLPEQPATATATTSPASAARTPAAQTTTVLPGIRRIVPAPDTALAEPPPRSRRKQRWLPWLLVVVLLEVIAGAGLFVTSRRAPVAHPLVPRVTGLDVTAANRALHKAGLTPEVSGEQYSANVAVGRVIFQRPPKGRREKAGTVVKMVISEGPHPTALPDLTGMKADEALSALKSAHLVAQVTDVYSETVPKGTVVNWTSLAGSKVFYGDTVKVELSKGYAPQKIPADLSGGLLKWAQAQAALADLHLTAKEEPVYSTTISAGFVVTTKPLPGNVVPGHSTVIVFTSIGPPYVKFSSLTTDSVATAEQKLSSLGLNWRLFGPPGADYVITTFPLPGTAVRVGSTIDLYLY